MGIDILGVDILGIDIILAPTRSDLHLHRTLIRHL